MNSIYHDFHTHLLPEASDVKALINLSVEQIPPENSTHAFSTGIWPREVPLKEEIIDTMLSSIYSLAEQGLIQAIGETGLDRLGTAPLDWQEYVFRQQIAIAEEFSLPVIVHCVRAYPELFRIRKDFKADIPWIIHSFNANEQIARQALQHKFILSLNSATLQNADRKKMIISIPDNSLGLETDDSGDDIKQLYALAASLRAVGVGELKKITTENFNRLFWKR